MRGCVLYLVISRDDDLRVAEPRHLLARGEAAVRLLDERGQVVNASSSKLFQNLDLEEASCKCCKLQPIQFSNV